MNPYQPTTIAPLPAYPAYVPPAGLGGPVPPPRPRGGLVAALVGGVVALGGLGLGAVLLLGPADLVTDEVEAEIVRITHEQVGVTAVDVRCPDDIPVAVGSAVTCTAAVDGQPVVYTVTQDDDRGRLTITHTRLLAVAEVEAAVSERLTSAVGEDVTAVCAPEGRTVLVNEPGTPITCTAVNAAVPTITAEVTVQVDEAGSVSYALV